MDFDNNLNSAVATLRHVFGDSGRAPIFIETVPKVGYRLIRLPSRSPGGDDDGRIDAEPARTPVRPTAFARARSLDQLEQALARRDAMLVFVRAFPEFGSLKDNPRFERLARAIGRS